MRSLQKLIVLMAVCAGVHLHAQTWATDVAPIFYSKCTSCHHPAGIAPFSLITYSDAANEANDIKQAVQDGTMPPWPPDTTYTRFRHERVLTPTEIQTISDWVDNGIQQGNLSQAPTPPTYTNTPAIASPDLVVQIPTYTVNAASDLYRCFVVQNPYAQDMYLTQVEVIPGNTSIVHHVLVVQDTNSTCDSLDSADAGPGYTWTGGGFGSNTASGLATWTPGQGVYDLPDSFGIRVRANSYLIVQVHYRGGTFGQVDSTQVRFKLDSSITREVILYPMLTHVNDLTNGPLVVPANATRTFYAQTPLNMSISLLAIDPHMHLLGQRVVCFARDPMGDTIPLIHIPQWSFHWQGNYHYGQPVCIQGGSMLYAIVLYDNTVNNPNNPNSPPVEVHAGEASTDEMLRISMSYVLYQPGDEVMVIDSSVVSDVPEVFNSIVVTPQLYNPYPVPAIGEDLHVDYFLPESDAVLLELIDANGKTVRTISSSRMSAGFNSSLIETKNLATGTYVLRLTSNGVVKTKTVVL